MATSARATPHTILGIDDLMVELARVAARGYAIDDQENEAGARCVGVAIRDGSGQVAGALSVSGPASRITHEMATVIGARLVEVVAGIERQLGYADRPSATAS